MSGVASSPNHELEVQTGAAGRLKRSLVAAGKPLVRSSWPIIESVSRLSATLLRDSGLEVKFADSWNPEFDAALDQLPAPPNCTRDQYRLLLEPTAYRKLHALVLENKEPIALISLRQRVSYWEPVAYGCMQSFIAPARDSEALARAMNALGVEVRIPSGFGPELEASGANIVFSQDSFAIDTQSDFEGYWLEKHGPVPLSFNKPRKRCKNLETRIDGEGDLEWILNSWVAMWENDPEGEICQAPDRIRFWASMGQSLTDKDGCSIHTITLLDGDTVTAGVIHLRIGNDLYWQCTSRLAEYNRFGVGTRAMDVSVGWAAENGLNSIQMGGGAYKVQWGPYSGASFGAIFRPAVMNAFRRFDP